MSLLDRVCSWFGVFLINFKDHNLIVTPYLIHKVFGQLNSSDLLSHLGPGMITIFLLCMCTPARTLEGHYKIG